MKKSRITILLFVLFVILLVLILSISILKKNQTESWCREFAAKNKGLKDVNVMPICNYSYDQIVVLNGVSNKYYCFPQDIAEYHFERNTISPFLSLKHIKPISEGKHIFYTNVSEKSNSYRIVIMGDSVTEGFGLQWNESYPYLLQSKFDESEKKVEVLNAAHGAYYLGNYYYQLKKIIANYDFDFLIIGLNQNDIYPQWEMITSKEVIKYRLNDSVGTINLTEEELVNICIEKRKHLKPGNEILKSPISYLEEILETVKKENIPLLILVFPNGAEKVDPNYYTTIDFYAIDLISFENDANYIKYAWINNPRNDKNHPNKKGNEIIADEVFKYLESKIDIDNEIKE